ncbi:MarR family transcriptional regulator [Alcaligenes ammonioxydans]|jgi:DNA-binding MarR family transcriptional regulator|nr:MarR family transcriptional regulator [Alcaligenes ammonioxydans]EJC64855.1 MarR family regulatory protein [Alcaligenes faecalis subsp. faecalis NCIB 8687]MCH1880829.1 MarR family transcriptional regulator [Alcaligenes ammonioxydans]WGQ34588.1 MarR family transcriptional regulator [Alcaligenes faecalis]HRK86281.1 MarR family transcriptional regulator [Alcaligenes faecalis]
MMNEFPQLQAAQQLGRTYRSLMAAFDQQLGMPLPRWRILIGLYQENGCLSQKQLVRLLRIDPAAVTRQLKSIETLGLIERFTDEQDNRLTNVRLSQAGRELVEATLPRRRRLVEAMLQDFSDQDLNQLITLLSNWESALLKAGDKDLL